MDKKSKPISCPRLCQKHQILFPAGFYLPVNGTRCKACEGNTISTENATSCVPCAAGRAANLDKTECGTFSYLGAAKHPNHLV